MARAEELRMRYARGELSFSIVQWRICARLSLVSSEARLQPVREGVVGGCGWQGVGGRWERGQPLQHRAQLSARQAYKKP